MRSLSGFASEGLGFRGLGLRVPGFRGRQSSKVYSSINGAGLDGRKSICGTSLRALVRSLPFYFVAIFFIPSLVSAFVASLGVVLLIFGAVQRCALALKW